MGASIHKPLFLMLGVFVVGTVGYWLLLDNLSLIDSLYLTIITLTTVGYGDISPWTNAQPHWRLASITFTLILILFGMGIFLYAMGIVTEYVVSGQMIEARHRKRMARLIAQLNRHYIICGAGDTGMHIMREMERTQRPFAVIDMSSERLRELDRQFDADLCYIVGDATHDRTLINAGLDRAETVVVALPDEKDALFVVLTLNQIRSETHPFRIIARCRQQSVSQKLKAAGADVVVCPNAIAGNRMVSEMFRPAVTTFLDRMLRDQRALMRVEQVTIQPDAPLANVMLAESRIRETTGLMILAIDRPGKSDFIYIPDAQCQLQVGDVLITLGDMPSILKLRTMAGQV